ncbi:hypothetical protein A2V71_04230 [Candidatus Berkelbacteria bacterium RBG_13_40_8]|uniref:AAA+ ATPase domain-containing protein n=1 Tax=Candidatus Berkelbacteria bacterium RBG_13_40_8 TaxID=1797467 RepID=A0A1F5DNX7_9BACT|nr:MAG: hypothetical protein A2V71_04230 [Candidatus Berkelbacteria bacterium RBG_13_40_8]
MSNKTILNILLERNRITQTEASGFAQNATNLDIEKKLRDEKTVTSEDIAKAYALLYDLPFIRLENYNVSSAAFQLIPQDLIEKYKILAFEKEGDISGGKVKLALGSPGDLKINPPTVISDLKNKKGVSVDLYITTPEDIEKVAAKFSQNSPPPPVQITKLDHHVQYSQISDLKSVDLKNIKIPYEIISKFPIEISKKYRIIVFDSPSPSMIRVAVSDPYDRKVQEILDFVRQKNEIAIEEFVASPGDILDAIKAYYKKPGPIPKPEPPPPKPAAVSATAPAQEFPKAPIFPARPRQETPPPTPLKPPARPTFIRRPEEEVAEVTQTQGVYETEPAQEAPESDLDKFLGQEVNSVETLKQIAQSGNIPQILAASVALAVMKKASDIHIEPEEDSLRIRFRVDGVLRDIIKMPLEIQAAIISRIKILSHLKIDEMRIPQDGRFDVKTHGHEIDLRVSTLPTVRGEKAALRILDKTKSIYTFEELGIAGRNLKILEENIKKPFGVILATGPTGSGKSTTLYSILQKISNPQVNVITLEDPVEYEIPGINQCQVKPKIGFSFAEGLRSVLRQDPNIIMVGEIRDAETAGMATHAALTGHLVLTTLHTNDAAGALPRLINMGIEPFLITSSINAIIGQRLVRKICSKCKKEIKLPDPLLNEISKDLEKFNLQKPYKFYEGAGCAECNQGFSGRIGIYEVLAMSEKVEEIAIRRRPASEILSAAIEEGMVTMKQDGLIKAIKGVTTVSEVLRVTTSG